MENILTDLLVVAVALIDEKSRVLMQKRPEGSVHASLWEFPGGKVEFGESTLETAIREIDEELGVAIDASDLQPLTFASGDGASGRLVILLYTCRRWRGEPLCLDGEAIGWYSAGELAGLEKPPLDYPLAESVADLLELRSG